MVLNITVAAEQDLELASDISTSQHGRNDEQPCAIDVDLFEFEDTLQEKSMSDGTCKGYTLDLPVGKSPYSCYPFALHNTLVFPWDLMVKNGVMMLFA